MTKAGAETVVAGCGFATFAMVAGERVAAGTIPSGRQVAATCIAFAALGAIAGIAPDIGGGLAIATMGTAAALYGLPLANKFGFLSKDQLPKSLGGTK